MLLHFFIFLCCAICSAFSIQITSIPIPNAIIPENAVWDPTTQSLYFSDLFSPYIWRYSWKDEQIYEAEIEGSTGCGSFIPLKCCPGLYAAGLNNTMYIVRWNGSSPKATIVRKYFSVENNTPDRIHVAIAEENGIYGGTFATQYCSANNQSIFQYSEKWGLKYFAVNLRVSTGFAYSCETKKYYHLDGCSQKITIFNRDTITGYLYNQKSVINLNQDPKTLPVGLAADNSGNLLMSLYRGSALLKLDLKTKILTRIPMPAELVTAPVFGGPNMDYILATSATLAVDIATGTPAEHQPSKKTLNGYLFIIKDFNTQGCITEKISVQNKV